MKEESTETTISCKITGLTAQASVVWLDGSKGTDVTTLGNKDDLTPSAGSWSAGEQTATLKVKGASAKGDKDYYCKVTSSSPSTSDASETAVSLNVYGEIQERVLHD